MKQKVGYFKRKISKTNKTERERERKKISLLKKGAITTFCTDIQIESKKIIIMCQ